ncbi:Dolichyl-diphosphooligosaccharide--protein glycosyltransferase subunit 2 [Rhodotorula toruloides]|nr:Dolichyl-diphosphooligosaccharide--protein glycosyltransferase subunit 2 [Rhodotorula toruloides]
MDSGASRTVATHAMDDRIPLPADTNVVPPRYRPIISREWASDYPTYYAEFEEIYWMFDGWDALADELYADWLLYMAEAKRVRAEIEEMWKGKKTFAEAARQAAHETWLYEENKRLYDLGGKLKERLEGPGASLNTGSRESPERVALAQRQIAAFDCFSISHVLSIASTHNRL